MTKGDEFDCNFTNYEDGTLQQEYSGFVQDNLDNLLERYQKAAVDPSTKALWEQIGEDLSNPSEEKRENAFTTAYNLLPELGGHLMDMLDERETHYEGWRHERGRDQRFVNEGMDYLSQLYIALVEEGRFQTNKSKDPRSYFRRALTNWQRNQHRKDQRLTQLDEEEWNKLIESPPESLAMQLSKPSAEDEALKNINEGTLHSELVKPGYLTEREYQLYNAIYVEAWTAEELAQQNGIKAGAVRQALSEVHQKMILRRDRCIAAKIVLWRADHRWGCPYFKSTIDFTEHPEWFIKRIEDAIKPALMASTSLNGSEPIFLPLTTGIGRRPGRLYIYNANDKRVKARLCDYLRAQGVDPNHYYLYSGPEIGGYFLGLTGYSVIDEIVREVHQSYCPANGVFFFSLSDQTITNDQSRISLGLLSFIENLKERRCVETKAYLTGEISGDISVGYDNLLPYPYKLNQYSYHCKCDEDHI